MNPLHQIPAKARTYVYLVYAVASLAVGAAQVGYAAVPAGTPTWLSVALAVVPFVGAGIGATAATHTPSATAEVALADDRVPGPDHLA